MEPVGLVNLSFPTFLYIITYFKIVFLNYVYLDILRQKCEICQLYLGHKDICGFSGRCLQACYGPGEVLISLSYLLCIGSKTMTDPKAEN
jgi:hypothetical protein